MTSAALSPAFDFAKSLPGINPDVYTAADFRAVAEIIYSVSGNVLPEGKAMLVYSRLAPLVRETGTVTFGRFIEKVRAEPEMMARAVAALTTNHTFFYRESHHFEHFEQEVRPGLIRAAESGRPVRLWSAGCSSGEETWSLVLTLLGSEQLAGRRLAQRDLRILASDLAPHALTKARAAQYAAKDLSPIPAEFVQPWVQVDGETAEIGNVARSLVRFRQLNLLHEWPFSGQFEVIFCRNVMIYFDLPTNQALVERFARQLVPGGHLYIGHSERVTGPAAALLEPVGPTIYRRKPA